VGGKVKSHRGYLQGQPRSRTIKPWSSCLHSWSSKSSSSTLYQHSHWGPWLSICLQRSICFIAAESWNVRSSDVALAACLDDASCEDYRRCLS